MTTSIPALDGFPGRQALRSAYAEFRATSADQRAAILVYFGLDRIDSVNATFGVETGDAYLFAWAQRSKALVKGSGRLYHLMGSQFAILFTDLTDDAELPGRARQMANRLLHEASKAFSIGDQLFDVSLSAGVILAPLDGTEFDELMAKGYATRAAAKRRGTNKVSLFSDEAINVGSQLDFVSELSEAAGRDQLRLHYQPIVNLATGKIMAAEALVRWQHPQRGLLMPDSFISLAEDTGLISGLGAWCLGEVCREFKRWQDAGAGPARVAVNVSPRQLSEYGFVDVVDRAIRQGEIDPTTLEIEITENVMVSHPQASARILRHLKSRGLRIVVDDFGAGYSSLVYLHQFPVDKIKIDRTYIARMLASRKDRAIISATVRLAHELGLEVVAEGVESVKQIAELRALGCDIMQGYLFSHPLPGGEFSDWIRSPEQSRSLAGLSG